MFIRALTLIVLTGVVGLAATSNLSGPSLVDAARNNDAQTLRTLLAQKPDVNARSGDGSTALPNPPTSCSTTAPTPTRPTTSA